MRLPAMASRIACVERRHVEVHALLLEGLADLRAERIAERSRWVFGACARAAPAGAYGEQKRP